MYKIIQKLFFWAILFSIVACSNSFTDEADSAKTKESEPQKVHGEAPPASGNPAKTPTAEALKKNKLNGYPHKSIGEAFDAYNKVATKEWQEDIGRDGRFYVDFICWFGQQALSPAARKNGVVKKGLDIKFVVQESGEAYIAMASRLFMMADGKYQSEVIPLVEAARIVDAIYNNNELDF